MFEARFQPGGHFKTTIEAIKDTLPNLNLRCSSIGISSQEMDSAHVSLVSFFFNEDAFEHFRCDHSLVLGIPVEKLFKILKCAELDDIITLKSKTQSDKLQLIVETIKQTRIMHFDLKLMEIDSEHLSIPETEYKVVIQMSSTLFSKFCKKFISFGDAVTISTTKDCVKFQVNGDASESDAKVVFKHDGSNWWNTDKEREETKTRKEKDKGTGDTINIIKNENVKMQFSMKYLSQFSKSEKLSPFLYMKLLPDTPILIEYPILTDEGHEIGHLKFYLAPKIDDAQEQSQEQEQENPKKKGKRKNKSGEKEGESSKKVKDE